MAKSDAVATERPPAEERARRRVSVDETSLTAENLIPEEEDGRRSEESDSMSGVRSPRRALRTVTNNQTRVTKDLRHATGKILGNPTILFSTNLNVRSQNYQKELLLRPFFVFPTGVGQGGEVRWMRNGFPPCDASSQKSPLHRRPGVVTAHCLSREQSEGMSEQRVVDPMIAVPREQKRPPNVKNESCLFRAEIRNHLKEGATGDTNQQKSKEMERGANRDQFRMLSWLLRVCGSIVQLTQTLSEHHKLVRK